MAGRTPEPEPKKKSLKAAEQVLVPTLRAGDVVIRDNLSSHLGAKVRHAIEAKQARLVFLPAYHPDLESD